MTILLTEGRTFRGAIKQRFRFCDNGQQYYFTQTKRGKTSVYIRMPPKLKAGYQVEQWRKLTDATEQAQAISDVARMYSTQPCFTQFFPKREG
jgi:hypothetical protein